MNHKLAITVKEGPKFNTTWEKEVDVYEPAAATVEEFGAALLSLPGMSSEMEMEMDQAKAILNGLFLVFHSFPDRRNVSIESKPTGNSIWYKVWLLNEESSYQRKSAGAGNGSGGNAPANSDKDFDLTWKQYVHKYRFKGMKVKEISKNYRALHPEKNFDK